ncbi:MAG: nucleotide pyrophosphohydrolase [Coriobacteriia bacterium]|nr:nucleotide pyrophosphohydrolase [Coriobacteriia bacterium]
MTFEEATAEALSFRDERNWKQFHNPKDLAISISLEASELLEAFQWSAADLYPQGKRDLIAEELADIAIYCMYFADAMDVNLADAVHAKIQLNAKKYPVDKARGSAKKYKELQP